MFTRPNWKDESAYREIEKTSLLSIAWEFLRRNPAYQADWLKYAEQVRQLAAIDCDIARYAGLFLTANATDEMFNAIGNQEEINALSSRFFACGFYATIPGVQYGYASLDVQFGSPWGIERICHPQNIYFMNNPHFIEAGNSITSPSSHSLRELETQAPATGGLLNTKWLSIQVDLSLPLEVIEASVMWLIRSQRSVRIKRKVFDPMKHRAVAKAKYTEYLRILDGEAGGNQGG